MYVYLIQSGKKKTDPVKVGFSKDPETRIKTLQTGNPVKLELIMKIKCNNEKHARTLEKALHEMLGTQNVYLEWFRLKKTHIMKMLTAFANNESFDQVKHAEKLQHYSSMPGDISLRKKYRGLLKQHKEMEISYLKTKIKLKDCSRFISNYLQNDKDCL